MPLSSKRTGVVIRPLKRLLVFLSELGLLFVGLALSVLAMVYFNSLDPDSLFVPVAFVVGVILTITGFFFLRRYTRKWKIRYDAAGWVLSEAARKLHPARVRFKRRLRKTLIWIPSACAAFVLFFFPIATHLVRARSHYLAHYRVPVPWTFAVFSWPESVPEYSYATAIGSGSGAGRFGVTPFEHAFGIAPYGYTTSRLSMMIFGSLEPDSPYFEFNHRENEQERSRAGQLSERGFRLGAIFVSCWQYIPEKRMGLWGQQAYSTGEYWEIHCETPVDVRQGNFYAAFYGRREDRALFYAVVANVTPVR